MRPAAALLLTLAASMAAVVHAAPGLTGAAVLDRPVGARASSMGRAFTAAAGDPEGLLYNPAGLAFVPGRGLHLSYMNGFAGGAYGFAAAPLKLPGFVLTPGLLYFDSGVFDLDIGGASAGSVTAEKDQVGLLSAACRPLPSLALGATAKFASLELAETAASSSQHYDLGLLYRVTPRFSVGAASLNNGGSIKYETESAPPPASARAGAAWSFPVNTDWFEASSGIAAADALLTADWSRVRGGGGRWQAGGELNTAFESGLLLSFRAGWLAGRDEEGLTFGFGLRRPAWSFSIGYEAARELEARVPVSLTLGF